MDSMTAIVDQALRELAASTPELAEPLETIAESLALAPRIVVVGRLKAGKSTLVNALVGAPVSETAALEATNVVTVFTYGAPDRAQVYLRDGRVVDVVTKRGQITQLPADARDIVSVRRWMPVASLRDYSLIDTPGLATLTQENEDATRRALITGFDQTRDASVDADGAIFLFDTTPRRDEMEFLSSLGFTPLNTLGVLSRADGFGEGPVGETDPLECASRHARQLAQQLHRYVATVVPVAGLLAETSHTGAVTEQFARHVGSYQGSGDVDLLAGLLDPRREADEELTRVVELIGEYGLLYGRQRASMGAASLTEWLMDSSQLPALKDAIQTLLTPAARVHRVGRVIGEVERLAYRFPQQREAIRQVAHRLRSDARLRQAVLMMDCKAVMQEDPESELVDILLPLISGVYPADKVGLDRYASAFDILEQVRRRREVLQSLMFSSSPAQEAAIVSISQALDAVERDAQALT